LRIVTNESVKIIWKTKSVRGNLNL